MGKISFAFNLQSVKLEAREQLGDLGIDEIDAKELGCDVGLTHLARSSGWLL
jgi:hypothetical protein